MSSPEPIRRRGPGAVTAVILPGWATDWRFFEPLAMPCGVAMPESFVPSRYMNDLADWLARSGTGKVTVAGWSLGGFAAVEFAKRHPEHARRLVLAGARRSFASGQMVEFRRALFADRVNCLKRFYRECFLPGRPDDYRRFRGALLKHYLEEMRTGDLEEGLEYLATCRIEPGTFPSCPVTFVHGAQDPIAPVAEVRCLAGEIPSARITVLADAGHAVCLTDEFWRAVSDA